MKTNINDDQLAYNAQKRREWIQKEIRDPLIKAFSESYESISQWLIMLNGTGLIASLAFLGTTFSDRYTFGFVPFLVSILLFGLGCLFAFFLVISGYSYFSSLVKQYKANINDKFLREDIINDEIATEVLKKTNTETNFQKLCKKSGQVFIIISSLFFMGGMFSGFIYLLLITKDF
jgi:hypothetical protein